MANPDNERGKILYGDRFKQPLIFEGMQIGKLYPTDIDAAFEYHNRLFVFFEVKMYGKEVPYGQRVALCRLCNALAETDKDAFWLLCYHDIADTSQAVDLSKTRVARIYYQGKEHILEPPRNAKEVFTKMLNWAKDKEFKEIFDE